MTRIAYLVTSAREMTLADGTPHPTGYFAEEALKPYERFTAAGFDVTVITPDGKPPYADPYGLSWFFHYPDDDKDYLASVVRTFAHDVDDIRLTLHQNTELGLAAARRVANLLEANGSTKAEAHRIVSAAAKTAWRQDRQFADVLAGDPALAEHGLTAEQIQAEVDAQRADSEKLAALRKRRAPIAALCHGPAMLLSAPERADELWLFGGYRMTSFTDEEEDQTEAGRLGMAWLLDVALKNTGAVFDDGPSAWISHVVVDRNLITGQNPGSTEATADAVIKKLTAPARQAA